MGIGSQWRSARLSTRASYFVLYINDLPDGLKSSAKMYADDSKILATVNSEEDQQNLQEDIFRACKWSNKWLMSLNNSLYKDFFKKFKIV